MADDKEDIEITVLRSGSGEGEAVYVNYKIPSNEVITILDALDYIRENLDSSLGYYSHQACGQGMCEVCNMKANNTPMLACQSKVQDKMIIEPLLKKNIVVDLVNITERR